MVAVGHFSKVTIGYFPLENKGAKYPICMMAGVSLHTEFAPSSPHPGTEPDDPGRILPYAGSRGGILGCEEVATTSLEGLRRRAAEKGLDATPSLSASLHPLYLPPRFEC